MKNKTKPSFKWKRLIGALFILGGLLFVLEEIGVPLRGVYARIQDQVFVSSNNKELAFGSLEASAAFVMDADNGDVLFYKNENKPLPPASTTKIMTALLAVEQADPVEGVIVGSEVNWTAPDESKAGLAPGQLLTWRELISAMMLPSGNDAARTIAVQIGMKHAPAGSTRQQAYDLFVNQMNKKAAELGMTNTQFTNPHGMPSQDHYSTAKDLAVLARAAMGNEIFRQIVMEPEASLSLTSDDNQVEKMVYNRNLLLQLDSGHFYEGANGIKTGYTDQAGYCLVSSANRNGHKVIAVALHSTKDQIWSDSHTLLNYGFAHVSS
ncbi:D-alanyl-D-alanine carboxypeptidase family protein [Paenibacillus sp. UMB4589-SE434]|uniref:D-alanyl-D-alanine carboxypeptidase family protein n=1 Tax=Paenibacillus sp. UMB4589-SE434 TaxID=3046314 RepID=UPI00254AD762|nr:D-alanyl-D-alanine carboxypeptidase family protein [Paenibacillus sp. UMB4589-SE434]MDK8183451.1 D-alanyl-D-alanine carboxypeptidase family protein [Paenibacillus sp. UMB4589-SE434]